MTGDQNLHSRVFALDDIQIRAGGDGRTVTAYAAVFDSPTFIVDQDGEYDEQIARTAFDKTVQERAGRIGVFYNHAKTLHGTPSESGSVPIGVPLEAPRADGKGLLTVTRYNKTPLADAVLESIRNGDITGQSFTGRFIKSTPTGPYLPDRSTGQRTLVTRQEIALIEYGPTPIPAYSDAAIVGVRSQGASGNLDAPNVADLDAAAVAHATAQGWTMPDGACPIRDLDHHGRADLDTALVAVDSTTADDVRAHITQRAAELGLSSLIPASWPSTSGRTEPAPRTPAAVHGTGAAVTPTAPSGAASEPHTHSANITNRSTNEARTDMDDRMTVEERAARQSEIRARLQEIDSEYSGATMPAELQQEWDGLLEENETHGRALADSERRQAQLQAVLAANPGATERTDRAGFLGGGRQAPAVHIGVDVYDTTSIRTQARNPEEAAGMLRDRAMRAIEIAQFPGAESREAAQERASYLVDTKDDEHGTLARRMLTTGSPIYNRAFGKMMQKLSVNGLTGEEHRALSLGVDAGGGYAVPFQLDPTVILTSSGVINPLRQVARVEQIVGKAWEGVTSAGVTVTRGSEGDQAPDSTPTLGQPSVTTTRVQGFVPFSVEIERSWNEMRGEVTMLLQDAKDTEEAGSFITGDGTGTNPGGVIGTIGAGQKVGQSGSAGALTIPDDLFALETALPPRFRPRATWLGNKTIYNKVRAAAQSKGGLAGDLWARLQTGQPPELIGYSAYEVSSMDGTIESTGGGDNLVLAFGDFKTGFLIVDRIGMSVELVPHLFGANGRPTGQRGIYAYWSNNSKIIVPNAIRVLNVVSPT
ncbi:putative phage major capsid protein [Actinacidiphila reveromycinica]|uniref:Putative phage major capsid protein n=1 Tax=Actinacidiphila reveromycinica TaxID=659352 RepID=A0A7U3VRS2_9ACTN|nr:phage major capsid protein [Streptomyces sp. SN-593]BBB01069.1 putative phage major capsid protein [Streptomyces sp. SN-593]